MFEAFIASVCIALISLAGVFTFGSKGRLTGAHRYVLPVAIGVFLGVVFFELIPETLEMNAEYGSFAIVAGFLLFYLLSYLIDTYHHHHVHHTDGCPDNGATLLLLGDAIHNVADGVVIASAFIVNPTLGVATAIGVALHEIPQEIAEFGVLLKAGYSKKKAALLNLLSASSIIFGVLLTAFFTSLFVNGLWVLTGIAAGNLLYSAATDILPELQEAHKEHFKQSFLLTLMGVLAVALLFALTHERL